MKGQISSIQLDATVDEQDGESQHRNDGTEGWDQKHSITDKEFSRLGALVKR